MKWRNPKTGKLERRPPGVLCSMTEGYNPLDPDVLAAQQALLVESRTRVPRSVRGWLERSRAARWGDQPLVKASSVGWRDTLTPRRVLVADGAQVLNVTAETIMCPDFTLAADYLEAGDVLKYKLWFNTSTVITTPGTITFRLRWGGVGGVSLAASGAYAPDPTAASTNISGTVEYIFVCRSTGTAGTAFVMGRCFPGDIDDATTTTIAGNLNMRNIPTASPAAVSIDTTTAKALSPTVQFSVATATTQLTTHVSLLESLN